MGQSLQVKKLIENEDGKLRGITDIRISRVKVVLLHETCRVVLLYNRQIIKCQSHTISYIYFIVGHIFLKMKYYKCD